MAQQSRPFAQLDDDDTTSSEEPWLKLGWIDPDGTEISASRLPLSIVLDALSRDLQFGLSLGSSGVVALGADVALGGGDPGTPLLLEGLPHASLAQLLKDMLELVAEVPDESDLPDLERLVDDLERGAKDVRATLAILRKER